MTRSAKHELLTQNSWASHGQLRLQQSPRFLLPPAVRGRPSPRSFASLRALFSPRHLSFSRPSWHTRSRASSTSFPSSSPGSLSGEKTNHYVHLLGWFSVVRLLVRLWNWNWYPDPRRGVRHAHRGSDAVSWKWQIEAPDLVRCFVDHEQRYER